MYIAGWPRGGCQLAALAGEGHDRSLAGTFQSCVGWVVALMRSGVTKDAKSGSYRQLSTTLQGLAQYASVDQINT